MPACLVFVLQLKQSCRQKHATDKADVPILQRYVQIFGNLLGALTACLTKEHDMQAASCKPVIFGHAYLGILCKD